MSAQQGDLSLLDDPVAQTLLRSAIPARLAYTWLDGTPRVVPIAFQWTGTHIVLGSPPKAPKVRALARNPQVALTIDTEGWPAKVLMLRGTATVEMIDHVNPEYAAAMPRYLGEDGGRAWVEQLRGMVHSWARIAIEPAWAGILDFETRIPSGLAALMEEQAAGAGSAMQ